MILQWVAMLLMTRRSQVRDEIKGVGAERDPRGQIPEESVLSQALENASQHHRGEQQEQNVQ